ncbi:hypothetical protein OC845_001421 [Tilletia horrida]|nr:hypothetical protein OC845_001421 [Tilletia horrida]
MLLLPVLAKTARSPEYADSGKRVRVVQVSSVGHTMLLKRHIQDGWKDLRAINKPFWPEAGATWIRCVDSVQALRGEYNKSKVGNILLANRVRDLAQQNNIAISSASVHPGVVRTDLTGGISLSYGKIIGALIDLVIYPIQITPEQGALAQLYACTSPDLDDPTRNGVYLVPYGKPARPAAWARDESGDAGRDLEAFVQGLVKEKLGVDLRKVPISDDDARQHIKLPSRTTVSTSYKKGPAYHEQIPDGPLAAASRDPQVGTLPSNKRVAFLQSIMTGFNTKTIPPLNGKIALVTGANIGLGERSAFILALAGARVYLACRSESRVQESLGRIRAWLASPNKWRKDAPAAVASLEKLDIEEIMSRLIWLPLDLSSLKSIKKAVEIFRQKEARLDILLNCAGVMSMPYTFTEDGLEIQVGTNTVGHYVFTMLLFPVLAKTARLTEYADSGKTVRVVQVSSLAHSLLKDSHLQNGWKDLEAINTKFSPEFSATWIRYNKSKVGNILLANRVRDLAQRNSLAISSTSIHPGLVKTNLTTGVSLSYGKLLGTIAEIILYPFQISPEKGALAQLYACTSPDLDDPKRNGAYIVPYGKVAQAASYARDEGGEAGRDLDNFVVGFAKEKLDVDLHEVLRDEAGLNKL